MHFNFLTALHFILATDQQPWFKVLTAYLALRLQKFTSFWLPANVKHVAKETKRGVNDGLSSFPGSLLEVDHMSRWKKNTGKIFCQHMVTLQPQLNTVFQKPPYF